MKEIKKADFLSRDTFSAYKGYLAIGILCHHIYQFSGLLSNTYFGHFLQMLGGWAVGCFMLMSSFGLLTSYEEKGETYINQFPRKRILSFYVKYLFFLALYLIYLMVMKIDISLKTVVTSLTFGGTYVSFGWYLQLTLILYIAFWMIFKYVKRKTIRSLLLFAVGISLLIYYYMSYDLSYRLTPICAMLLGFVFAAHRDFVKKCLYKYRVFVCLISFAVLFMSYMIYIWTEIMGKFVIPDYLRTANLTIGSMGVVTFMLSFGALTQDKVKWLYDNPICSFLSKHSMEIYCIQGVLLGGLVGKVDNKIVFAIITFGATLVAAWMIRKILDRLTNICC